MSEKKSVFNWQIYIGFVLVATGGLFLADQLLKDLNLMATFWPLLVVLLGVTFFVGMLVAGRRGSGLAIPGAVITVLGILLFVQNLFDLWETWAYAWALLISAVGIGLLIMNLYIKRLALRRVAGLILGIGLLLFVVFGILFELIFFSTRPDSASGFFLGAGLVLLGLFILFSRILFGKGKRDIEVEEEPFVTEPAEGSIEGVKEVTGPEMADLPLGEALHPLPEGANFTGLHFKSLGEVILAQGDTCDLRIEGEEELLKEIQVEAGEGFLSITYKTTVVDWMNLKKVFGEKPLRYYVTMQTIEQLDLSGVGDLHADHLIGENLSIAHSGLGKMTVTGLSYQSLDVALDGLGEMMLEGEVQVQNVDLGGAGGYLAEDLKSQQANVSLTGAGLGRVWVEAELNAKISGAGSILYKGTPTIEKKVTGLGSIKPLE